MCEIRIHEDGPDKAAADCVTHAWVWQFQPRDELNSRLIEHFVEKGTITLETVKVP